MASGDVHILDVEFKVNLQIARGFIKQMMLADDRRVCEKYIRFCMSMKDSDQEKVKFHRNRFFKYLLKTMKRTVETQKASVYMNESQMALMAETEENETKQWSHDRRSYVSMKIIPGFGTLIYMACTDQPELGWDENGFSNFIDISDVPTVFKDQKHPDSDEQQQSQSQSSPQGENPSTSPNPQLQIVAP